MKERLTLFLMLITITFCLIGKAYADECNYGYAQVFDKDWKRVEPYVCLKSYNFELKVWTLKSDAGKDRKLYAPSFHFVNMRGNSYYEIVENNGHIVNIESARKLP